MPLGVGPVVSLGIAVAVWNGACGAHVKCNVTCSSGAGGLIDQTSLTGPIVTLTADPSCAVTQTPADAGGQVFVDMIPKDGPLTSGTCRVYATLADGSTWLAVLSWTPNTSECCGTVTEIISPYPKFMRADGGT